MRGTGLAILVPPISLSCFQPDSAMQVHMDLCQLVTCRFICAAEAYPRGDILCCHRHHRMQWLPFWCCCLKVGVACKLGCDIIFTHRQIWLAQWLCEFIIFTVWFLMDWNYNPKRIVLIQFLFKKLCWNNNKKGLWTWQIDGKHWSQCSAKFQWVQQSFHSLKISFNAENIHSWAFSTALIHINIKWCHLLPKPSARNTKFLMTENLRVSAIEIIFYQE